MQNITRKTLTDLLTDDNKMVTILSDLKKKEKETKLKHMEIVEEMRKELNFYRAKHEESRNLKMEVTNLTHELKTTKEHLNHHEEMAGNLKKKLDTVTHDKDAIQSEYIICKRDLLGQIYTYQNELYKAKSKLASQDNSRIREIQALHLEVETLTEINRGLESKLQKATNQKWEIAQKNEIIKLNTKKYSELKEQLDRVIKENELCKPVVVKQCKHKNNDLCKENQDLKNDLYIKTRQLAIESKKLEQKDHIIEEKEKQCEKLEDSMSRMLPPERAELILKYQSVIREQSEKITSLKAQSYMFQVKAEECKAELEKAIDREETNKKLYLNEKNRNYDLMEALKLVPEGKSIANVPEGKSGKVKLPPIVNVPEGKSGKVKLPPIVNVPHNQSTEKVTPQERKVKMVVLKPEEKLVLPPVTNTRKPVTSSVGQRFNLLPPLPNRSPQLRTAQRKKFLLTEPHRGQTP
ncbi:hypothetical protein D5F01_LYC01957 [Larimichthys crocea]|uniref:Uncharacterized protein n=1 Tax=Larimichthys crocea TaxID=215358 RepID=A0A6G0J7W6_LARCR|nr:hypothetical protein D5F01_LYC01957 [Larimichthys crocea]